MCVPTIGKHDCLLNDWLLVSYEEILPKVVPLAEDIVSISRDDSRTLEFGRRFSNLFQTGWSLDVDPWMWILECGSLDVDSWTWILRCGSLDVDSFWELFLFSKLFFVILSNCAPFIMNDNVCWEMNALLLHWTISKTSLLSFYVQLILSEGEWRWMCTSRNFSLLSFLNSHSLPVVR